MGHGRAHRWIDAIARGAPRLLALACLALPAPAHAHPGSGIVVDRAGMIYVVDMVNGVWKVDAKGGLTHMPGQAFHWMALDAGDRFATVSLPRGPGWEMTRIGSGPTLVLASDFPLAVSAEGDLYYPTIEGTDPMRILRLSASGQRSVAATFPSVAAGGSDRAIKGMAFGPDGTLYCTEDAAIRRISREGRVSTLVENVAPGGCAAPELRGLDVGADGAVYVAATGCKNVLKVTPSGEITVMPQIAKDPWFPTGVAVSGGDLYVLEFRVTDTEDRSIMLPRVRKIGADGATTILATVTKR